VAPFFTLKLFPRVNANSKLLKRCQTNAPIKLPDVLKDTPTLSMGKLITSLKYTDPISFHKRTSWWAYLSISVGIVLVITILVLLIVAKTRGCFKLMSLPCKNKIFTCLSAKSVKNAMVTEMDESHALNVVDPLIGDGQDGYRDKLPSTNKILALTIPIE
jgi:hypothetical protein